jgi:hypothetical protein
MRRGFPETARYASYQTGAAAAALTSIIKLDPKPEKVAELPTALVAFDRAGRRLAWLRQVTPGNPEASELVVRDLATGR